MKLSKNPLAMLAMAAILALAVGSTACKKDDAPVITDNLPNITGYPIVGTNQTLFFDSLMIVSKPAEGTPFYGQNAHYPGTTPNYVNNGDGTVTDMITGLMWQQSLDHNGDGSIDYADKLTYAEIVAMVDNDTTAGHTDWRLPTIKEMYSLIMFSGRDISGMTGTSTDGCTPFINTDYFEFNYGDLTAGERLIDVQFATTNLSVGNTEQMMFGVNFADGRIKGYGTSMMGQPKKFNYLLVRGNTTYGLNNFTDNGNGTISDAATGLMWMQDDSQIGMNWEDALAYAENFTFAGYSDWRLPDAKELQSIVDYSRSPQSSGSAAISPLFQCTQITNEANEADYPFYWTSTTHENMMPGHEGGWAVYVSFGRAMGKMAIGPPPAPANWIDVHGAGAQRSDPKTGNPNDYPDGHGPQGDAVRIFNHVRLVRSIN